MLSLFSLTRHSATERFQGENHINFGHGENYITLPIIPPKS